MEYTSCLCSLIKDRSPPDIVDVVLKYCLQNNIVIDLERVLGHATMSNSIETFIQIIQIGSLDLNKTSIRYRHVLYLPIKMNNLELVMHVVGKGANANLRDFYGDSALSYCCQYNDDPSILRYLVSVGAILEDSLVRSAVQHDKIEIVRYLAENWIDVKKCGHLVLRAIDSDNLEMIQYLVGKGMDVCSYDYYGKDVRSYAKKNRSTPEIKEYINSLFTKKNTETQISQAEHNKIIDHNRSLEQKLQELEMELANMSAGDTDRKRKMPARSNDTPSELMVDGIQ